MGTTPQKIWVVDYNYCVLVYNFYINQYLRAFLFLDIAMRGLAITSFSPLNLPLDNSSLE